MTNITEITDRLTLVVLNVRIWSGRKKLRAEDLHLDDGAIPPEELVSLGSKRVCDPEHLKAFHRLKQSAERACLRMGTRFLGGFAVPKDRTAELAVELDQIKATFNDEVQTFLASYDYDLERWIQTLPAFETAIRHAVEPAESVAGRLRFGYQLVEIKPAVEPGTLAEEVSELGDGIFAEVEQMARDLTSSFEGKDKLHRRALGTFTRVRNKLACLSFIDDRIQPVVDTIDQWLERLPATAPIQGALFNEGMGLALLLTDAERMARHGAGQVAGVQRSMPKLTGSQQSQKSTQDAVESSAVSPIKDDDALEVELDTDTDTGAMPVSGDDDDAHTEPYPPVAPRSEPTPSFFF
ncbi:hypothetical protein CKO15_13585 [Halorhodospira abdelmalekii]|uniref:DUF3150 domain-containing protein n=1 Tax=Halorhodospira abdelmalekii TaxID=421629 RepID=UPI001906F6D6|nr:DUF3150 domain-containing protein [Halorhodospira abdelmalekii]MBK1736272.1 hypothetical protein [Halorhodospira abdelmalekii]